METIGLVLSFYINAQQVCKQHCTHVIPINEYSALEAFHASVIVHPTCTLLILLRSPHMPTYISHSTQATNNTVHECTHTSPHTHKVPRLTEFLARLQTVPVARQ